MVRGQLHGMHSGGGSPFSKNLELDENVYFDTYSKRIDSDDCSGSGKGARCVSKDLD